MKKYTFQVLIGVLICLFITSMYSLYSDKKEEIKPQKISSTKAVNVKDTINSRENKSINYEAKKISEKALNNKITDLKGMLKKTEHMLKNYNKTANRKIITNQEIDKLVNIDLVKKVVNSSKLESKKVNNKTLEKTSSSQVNNSKTFFAGSLNTSSKNVTHSSITTDNSATRSNTTNNTLTSESSTNTTVVAEVQKLKTQIEDVKKVISQVSTNIN